jgi:U3 small nucleolar RNA-associated protein 18
MLSGSSSGVVNIYSRRQQQQQRTVLDDGGSGDWVLPEAPLAGRPLRSVLNLSTTVDSLAFNHDSQMLVLASRMKRDALRCVCGWGGAGV